MTPVNALVIKELSTASRLLEWCPGKRYRMLHEVRMLKQHGPFLRVPPHPGRYLKIAPATDILSRCAERQRNVRLGVAFLKGNRSGGSEIC